MRVDNPAARLLLRRGLAGRLAPDRLDGLGDARALEVDAQEAEQHDGRGAEPGDARELAAVLGHVVRDDVVHPHVGVQRDEHAERQVHRQVERRGAEHEGQRHGAREPRAREVVQLGRERRIVRLDESRESAQGFVLGPLGGRRCWGRPDHRKGHVSIVKTEMERSGKLALVRSWRAPRRTPSDDERRAARCSMAIGSWSLSAGDDEQELALESGGAFRIVRRWWVRAKKGGTGEEPVALNAIYRQTGFHRY